MTSIVRFADAEGRVANPIWAPISDVHTLTTLRQLADKDKAEGKANKELDKVFDALNVLDQLPKLNPKSVPYQPYYYHYKHASSDVVCLIGAETMSVRTNTSSRDDRTVAWGAGQITSQYDNLKSIAKSLVVLGDYAQHHGLTEGTHIRLIFSNMEHVKRVAAKVRNGKLAIKDVDDEFDFAKSTCFALYCAYENGENKVEGYVDAGAGLGTLARARTFESKLEAERFANKQSLNRYYPSFQILELSITLSNTHHKVVGGGKQKENFSDSRFRGVMARMERDAIEAALKNASYDDIRARMDQLEAERQQVEQGDVEGNAPERKRRM